MAIAVRGSRSGGSGGVGAGFRSFFSYRIFISAMFTLLFIVTVSVVITSRPPTTHRHSSLPSGANVYMHRTFLALNSDPLKTRLDLIYKQANDHITLVKAYAAYAMRVKLEISRQLKMFDDLAKNFSDLNSKPSYKSSLFETDGNLDEDVLRQFEKEVKDRVKFARSLVAESKENYDNQLKIQKLKDTIFSVSELLGKAKKNGALASSIAAKSIPKSLHCLAMRLVEERVAHPEKYKEELPKAEFEDPSLYHYAVFSDNVIAVSVVVRSVVKNAEEPWKHVFHVVTDRMNVAAMKVWFRMRPVEGGAHLEVKAVEDYSFLDSSYVPVLRRIESAKMQRFSPEKTMENATKDGSNMKLKNPVSTSMLNHLRFYLPEMYPKLHKILLLDDDVVVQKDMTGLWKIDLAGKERFNPKACAWAFGMNIFDLDAWRREKCTETYHEWQNLNEDQTLWQLDTLPPGLITFYSLTKSLDKSWHVLGLGYNPSISMDEIKNAAVIHYNGNMKPWLDIAMNQYKNLWTKYVDNDMEFVQMCNFGV
ncbi:probable galacturonosyltransferase 9 isoform X2 [Hibiscus syriacus]|uniref:probable galacturonosyltransferase 9 isoform X2 n=1 Tax=Hibiscus syriacus TaxID=106335 RepID=UPI001920D5A8|nr:probable galacturonosyltransferase 9 isoform X2 [Hibiscus syriacus]